MHKINLMKVLFAASALMIACVHTIKAEWTEANGSAGISGLIMNLWVNGSGIIAETPSGLFLSIDTGTTWTGINSPLSKSSPWIGSFGANTHFVFAGTGSGVLRSSDNGKNWQSFSTGLTSSQVRYFGAIGEAIIAVNSDGVFRAIVTDSSWTLWKRVNSEVTSDSLIEFITIGGNLLAGTLDHGIYLSSDSGTNWHSINTGLTSLKISAMDLVGNTIFAGTDSGVFRSVDNGTSWIAANSGLTGLVTDFASNRNSIIAKTYDGIFCSIDSGTKWIPADSGLPGSSAENIGQLVTTLATCGDRIIAGTRSGIYLYNNSGGFWTQVKSGLNNLPVTALIASETSILAGTDHYGVFRSVDDGANWVSTDTVFLKTNVQTLFRYGKYIFAGCWTFICRSSDDGNSWMMADSGIKNRNVYCFAANGNSLFAGTADSGVYISTDSGTTWKSANSGIERRYIMSLATSGDYIFAGTDLGVYRSNDNGTTWTNAGSSNLRVQVLVVNQNTIYIGTGGILHSKDNGTTWTTSSSPEYIGVNCFDVVGNNVFAGGDFGVFLLKENDTGWNDISPDFLKGKEIIDATSFAIKGNYIYVGTCVPNFWPGTGRGVWRRPLSDFPVANKIPKPNVTAQSDFKTMTSKVTGSSATISFFLPRREHVGISVYNFSGSFIMSITNRYFDSGVQTISWDTRSLPSGSYFIKIKTPANSCVKLFTQCR